MIGNAHIDPVWLWRWPVGVGEVLATCRTACDLLDENPQVVFTRSDVWVYQTVEELDPLLFERIRAHSAAGRWMIVGGWYVQPDCNLPLEESFQKHVEVGKRYFPQKLGVTVTVGYNVDSFGHAASLPRILADNGFDSYVMMRPMAHERKLPAELFRWRSTEEAGGIREVLTWRIPMGYCISKDDLSDHVRASVAAAVDGVDHVMCFYGVGDHGGGPTREQIAWIEAHQDSFDGARLIFSHPRAFFDAVKPLAERLPIVQGELQMHAVGCYSAGHSLKIAMRSAEHALLAAEHALHSTTPGFQEHESEKNVAMKARLDRAWEKVLFNQFHDTYGGTVIPAAYDDAVGQLASARDDAESILYSRIYTIAASMSSSREQTIQAFNMSTTPFDGFMQWEPWLEWHPFDGWLEDSGGNPVPLQLLPSTSLASMPGILLWPARLPAGAIQSYSLRSGAPPRLAYSTLQTDAGSISNERWKIERGSGTSLASIRDVRAPHRAAFEAGLKVVVMEDPSDTWSHDVVGYGETAAGFFAPLEAQVEEKGPLRASLRVDARFNSSSLSLWTQLYEDDPRIEVNIRVYWHETLRVAKLILPLGGAVLLRHDGIPGGSATRAQDGKESPVVDWTVAHLSDGGTMAVACPDCFGVDGTGDTIRFTLLRSPAYAWHQPARLPPDRAHRFMDQGEHFFRFTLLPGGDSRAVQSFACAAHRPPVCIDWTRGM